MDPILSAHSDPTTDPISFRMELTGSARIPQRIRSVSAWSSLDPPADPITFRMELTGSARIPPMDPITFCRVLFAHPTDPITFDLIRSDPPMDPSTLTPNIILIESQGTPPGV